MHPASLWRVRPRRDRSRGHDGNHRRVRRQEEIIWLRVQGFTRVVSLLPSSHNLAAYDEGELTSSHFPFGPGGDQREILADLYRSLDEWVNAGERVLVHQEELGDRVMGVVAGYLVWSGRLPGGAQAIVAVEQLIGHQMGPQGRDIAAQAVGLNTATGDKRRAPPRGAGTGR